MMVLLVSEVRDETIEPHESHGGQHKEVGLPPNGALLRKVHKFRHTLEGGKANSCVKNYTVCSNEAL